MKNLWSRLVFCHVPKTAGSSITRLLRDVMPGPHSVESTMTANPSNDIEVALKSGCTLISGHFNHAHVVASMHRAGVPDVRLVTTLRNPVDHLLSQFYHLVSRESLNMAYDTGLAALKSRAENSTLLEFFSCMGDDVGAFEPLFDNPQVRIILDKMSGPITITDTQEAIALLKKFDFIIFFEKLNESIAALCRHLGVTSDIALPQLMTNPLKATGMATLRRSELLTLMKHSRFDAVLYDVLLMKWREQVEQIFRSSVNREHVARQPPVVLADVIRASNSTEFENGELGNTIILRETSLFLHPPHGDQGALRINSADFFASGHCYFTADLLLEHPAAPPVAIDITIRSSSGIVACFATEITATASFPVRVKFPPLYGRSYVDIVISSQDPQGINDYATIELRNAFLCS